MPSKQTRRPSSLQSPYTSFFGTSYAPSPSERTELEVLISGAQQELVELDSEMFRIRVRRNRVQNFLDDHRTLLSPIRRLPTETLAEIFTHCLPTQRFPIRSLKEAPLLLTMVCRKWRKIAMTHPPLWNALHIHIASEIASNAHELELRQQGICEWIARSGALPLSFSLSLDEIAYNRLGIKHDYFFQSVMDLSPRLETFHLEVGNRVYQWLESISPQWFPILKRLSLSLDLDANCTVIDSKIPFVSSIPGMPVLAGLRINGFYPYQHLESTYVNHGSNLTELDLGGDLSWSLQLQPMLAILRGAPKLQHCSVHVQCDSVAQTYETVNLHFLRSLSIRFDGDREEDDFCDLIENSFRSLNCPALKALSVISSDHDHTMLPDRFAFTHLLGSLQHLRLEFTMTDEALVRCLALAPNLTVLEIVDCTCAIEHQNSSSESSPHHHQVQDTVLRRLTDDPSSHVVVLCPKLETFRLLVLPLPYNLVKPQPINMSTRALVEFLESRKGTDNRTSKLRECTILMSSKLKISAAILKRLTLLMQDGMLLRVGQADRGYSSCKSEDDPESRAVFHSSNALIPFDAYIFRDLEYGLRRTIVDNISDL
ncbi:hypothetical protein F5878DRAFT_615208 [Lentinula raphanica]|uniref:F-box domain-containing protein n=1 Tax=Lentinula raphanica TaxID=153919 RepID=A0AA38UIN3_9AGAR|nr:hypothetical protein F5878DRAFT_615208 [Lentinula raphanica]